MKTDKLGGVIPPSCVVFASSPPTSAELTSVLSLPLTAPKQQTDNPLTSPTFLGKVQNGYDFSCWTVKDVQTFCMFFSIAALLSFEEYCGHCLCSSGTGLGAEVFALAFYKPCVCSKCRNCSKIFCSVLTWSPFEVDKYQLLKQKIKQKQLKTYSEVNRWTVCKTKQFPKGIFSTWSLFNSWLKINNADRVCVGGLWYMNSVSTVGW